MTDAEKKAMLEAITGESDDGTLSVYLTLAKNIILAKAYPYFDTYPIFPTKYDTLQVEIAAYLLNKRGAEGETSHNENGVSRSYENGDIPSRLICRITPVASAIYVEEGESDETTAAQSETD